MSDQDFQRFELDFPNGTVRGNILGIENAPMVVFLCGHNGFYHFAFFPVLQKELWKAGFSSVAFNYSHCGISGDGDYFDDLESYEKNCRRLEVEDAVHLIECLQSGELAAKPSQLFILGHSMGGFNTGFVVKKLLEKGIRTDGLIFLNALKTLNVRTPEIMKEWQENGVYYRRNGRTNQELPQGKEFLEETLQSNGKWNLEKAISDLKIPVLVAHGSADEAVPYQHGTDMFSWIKDNNTLNRFVEIENGTHTLNTSHTGNRDSAQLQEFSDELVSWLRTIVS